MAAGELDKLLEAKFGLRHGDMLAALQTMPAIRTDSTELPEREGALLDAAGFSADPDAYAIVSTTTRPHQ